ncbi:Short-chain dehydrogenase TIC 32 chloroplastic [Melia azedarach]|uniref:Short-chain dehydrogenase TIC 32 chloroplastic n=1 Tax=Melia azedarach TaxID=155640 RepID=A0ACC1X3F4_MELAZ|nr:Short-chain dehydrogenase TIC 32 chloroplastic [Melia azedarach]
MWWLRRKEQSGFSASSTAEEVTEGIDGTGLTAIVTGASSGIGSETTRVLALRGVHVIMGVRNKAAAGNVKDAIVKEIPRAKVDTMELDLSSLSSVRKFASDFNSQGRPLNILINNAGIMGTKFMLSEDNIELQFATNHLGHFLLTYLLLDTMKKTAHECGKKGRIVNVSSAGHRMAYREGIRFDKINDKSGYNGFRAYAQSKLANILHANELARRLKEDRAEITANSVHPGAIITNIIRYNNLFNGVVCLSNNVIKGVQQVFPSLKNVQQQQILGPLKNIQQGAATTCYVALHPDVEGKSGLYFSDNNIAKPSSQALDTDLARKLWDFSMDLINKCSRPTS